MIHMIYCDARILWQQIQYLTNFNVYKSHLWWCKIWICHDMYFKNQVLSFLFWRPMKLIHQATLTKMNIAQNRDNGWTTNVLYSANWLFHCQKEIKSQYIHEMPEFMAVSYKVEKIHNSDKFFQVLLFCNTNEKRANPGFDLTLNWLRSGKMNRFVLTSPTTIPGYTWHELTLMVNK